MQEGIPIYVAYIYFFLLICILLSCLYLFYFAHISIRFAGGWPSIFYVFGFVGAVWSVAFLVYCYEEPEAHPNIAEDERKYVKMSSI